MAEIMYSVVLHAGNAPVTAQNSSNSLLHQGGGYNTLVEVLPQISALGATSIHISCVFKPVRPRWDLHSGLFTEANHGFWPANFRDLNPNFGSLAELEGFISRAREMGIKIVGEMTFHFGPGAEFLPGWHSGEKCMGVLPKLDLENPEAMNYVLQTVEWFADMGFWGVRLDTAFELQEQHLRAVIATAQNRELFLIGEVFEGDPDVLSRLQGGVQWTDYPLNFNLFEVIAGKGSVTRLHDLLSHPYSRQQSLATFVDNHDVASFVRECVRETVPGDYMDNIKQSRARLLMALTLIFAIRGIPTVYYLDAWGLNLEGMASPTGQNRQPAPWAQRPMLAAAVSKLAALRHARPELETGTYQQLWLPGPANVWAFAKVGAESTVVILNNEDRPVDLDAIGKINAQGILPDGTAHCLLRPGKTFLVEGGRISGVIGPRSVYLLGS